MGPALRADLTTPPADDLKSLLRLNFHHLGYFGAIIRHGGMQAAARALCVSPATISGQIKELERALGRPLFVRRGQRLSPTRFGEQVYRHVSAWFAVGRQLVECLGPAQEDQAVPLDVGIADGVPLLVAARLLAPALADGGRIACRSAPHEQLIDLLVHHRLDLVLTDRAPASGAHAEIRAIEASAVAWCVGAAAGLAAEAFPQCLHGAPVVLPAPGSALRESVDAWLALRGVKPRIVAECTDTALVKALGATAGAAFPVPALVAAQACRQWDVTVLGTMPGETERYLLVASPRRHLPPTAERILDRPPR